MDIADARIHDVRQGNPFGARAGDVGKGKAGERPFGGRFPISARTVTSGQANVGRETFSLRITVRGLDHPLC